MKKIALSALLLWPTISYCQEDPINVFKKIDERMSYMQDVAIYKAIHGLPIEDLKREEIVLKKSSLASENYGLNVDSMKSFTVALMSSAKAIQYRYRADMLSKSVDTHAARDLKSEIRPALIKLGSELNMSISEYLGSGNVFSDSQYSNFSSSITSSYLKEADKKLLFSALKKIDIKN